LDEAKKDLKESKTNLNSEQRMLRFLEKRLAEDNYSLRVPHLVQVKKTFEEDSSNMDTTPNTSKRKFEE